jgi:hypothetical protein
MNQSIEPLKVFDNDAIARIILIAQDWTVTTSMKIEMTGCTDTHQIR